MCDCLRLWSQHHPASLHVRLLGGVGQVASGLPHGDEGGAVSARPSLGLDEPHGGC